MAWIDTYAGAGFDYAVDAASAITDEVAAAASPAIHTQMHNAFRRAMQLEWMFWDSAYRDMSWPV